MIAVAENRYGKSRVRLMQVKRAPGWHELRDWTVDIFLEGRFDACFIDGDNHSILPTDTMKNTVYFLARKSSAASMEDFARELGDFFLARNPQVSAAEVRVSAKAWEHMEFDGQPQPTSFVQSSSEQQTTKVSRRRDTVCSISSGFDNLVILKTSGSAFEGYFQDPLTTLAPTKDRLLGTKVRGNWNYSPTAEDFYTLRSRIRELLLSAFSRHQSKSVQHTLYAMGRTVLEEVNEIEDINLVMPNQHCLLVDLSRFGQDNPNEIFVPIDEPHGYIEARLHREK